ncbi:LacI family DNA-binding transcriptional regulator [Heyndrickxia acidiproducens]|uniref:LacI family DNA-binding transcriptional regulator n=1 Tax=Heyndrickxia acidiproducens TaxID=1121084 RepID=UPI00035C7F4D|nr:LacI family DNA-binding transcriptional regulator [Heyndrickxia acidiproducens]
MVTIRDVAKAAGVSTATVSRIINNKGEAGPETIERVQKIIKELNYKPNTLAKSLSKRNSDLIALLIPSLENPFFPELVHAIEETANEYGYHVYLCNSDDKRSKVKYYLDSILSHYASGAIINSLYVESEDLEKLENSGIYTVTIDRSQFDHPFSAVTVNHKAGAKLAVEHLIKDGGCRHIVHISGPRGEKSSEDRLSGYLETLATFNSGLSSKVVYGNFDMESGYKAVQKLIQSGTGFDGIFSSNDAMALGAMRACAEAGLDVPSKVKVVGYDNIYFSRYATPRLSTVDQRKKDIGRIAVEELLRLIQDKNEKPKKYEIKPELLIRESSVDQ